jgi:putative transposase
MKLKQDEDSLYLSLNHNVVGTKEIARDVKASQRRVQQIIKAYKETGQEPVFGEKVGRPSNPLLKKKQRSSEQPTHAIYLVRGCWRR